MFETKPLQSVLVSGSSHRLLAEKVAEQWGTPLLRLESEVFSNGEYSVQILEPVLGKTVFILQSIAFPIHNAWMELFILIDALRRAGASRVEVILPYMSYGRQDRLKKPPGSLTAKLMADLLASSGASSVTGVDFHSRQMEGFFSVSTQVLSAQVLFLNFLKKESRRPSSDFFQFFASEPEGQREREWVILSPDAGGLHRVQTLARACGGLSVACVDKERMDTQDGKTQVLGLLGSVRGKKVLLLDDLVDTGGTLVRAAQAALSQGALSVHAFVTHGVFSRPFEKIAFEAPIQSWVITDTLPFYPLFKEDQSKAASVHVLSVAGLLADVIRERAL